MKVLFAVSNEEISESIIKRYQTEYKQIISSKNVYYFNAILKEIQKDKTYDRIVISEDLEVFSHTQYEQIDKFIFEKLDSISDEASNMKGKDTPIILICSDRRTKSEQILLKLFGIGIYDALIGPDRSVEELCKLLNRPRTKKEAKVYYKIEAEEVNYQAESENDVSEIEIQNIITHYKKLGKNEDRYIDSFSNIAAQYNDVQLRIISKFLPLNVRAVLEENSRKYQEIMSFNNSVSDNLRKSKNEENDGPTSRLLKSKLKERQMSVPVVIPSEVNLNTVRKLSKTKKIVNMQLSHKENIQKQEQQNIPNQNIQRQEQQNIQRQNPVREENEIIKQYNLDSEPKRKRGRPPKQIDITQEQIDNAPKKKRGRPPKAQPIVQKVEEVNIQNSFLPGFEYEDEENTNKYNQNNNQQNSFLPGFEYEDEENTNKYNQNNNQQNSFLSGVEDKNEKYIEPTNNYNQNNPLEEIYNDRNNLQNNNYREPVKNPINNYNIETSRTSVKSKTEYINTVDLSRYLTPDKKIISFLGTSKNGTSFIINNLAELLSSMGIKVAILDTTSNRNSYYIYTKNEESLRNIATETIDNLANGIEKGIQVNKNLTVFTSLPEDNEGIGNVDEILETLIKNYSLVLIDTDFNTPIGYFKQSKEMYLVQTLDILTIQPLTAFLRELKAKNILEEDKIRIIINKAVKVKGISEKTIIGGMAFYNDPAMSFMTELFDRNMVKYITIPFEEETYIKYLENIINCEISLKEYSKIFMNSLRELGNMAYTITTGKQPQGGYKPPSVGYSNPGKEGFSPSINSTLNQMKKKY